MKYFLLKGALLLCWTQPLMAQQIDADSASALRIMTYNIWNGFDWGKDSARRAACINWIQEQAPDVLALQELCGYTPERLKADAAEWGHPYAEILKVDGYPVGLTSKQPIEVLHKQTEGLWHGFMQCKTYDLDFWIVHLSPADCEIRLQEAEIISQSIELSKADKYVILGDFNAHSAFDAHLLEQRTSLREKYESGDAQSKYTNLRLGEFDYAVISRFLALPAVDVIPKFVDADQRFTFPAPALVGIHQTAEQVRSNKQRIDYILLSPELARSSTRALIFNEGETDTFSDHFPLMVEIK